MGAGEGNKGALLSAESWGQGEAQRAAGVKRKAVDGRGSTGTWPPSPHILPTSGPWDFSTSQAIFTDQTSGREGGADGTSPVLCHCWSRDEPHQELELGGVASPQTPAEGLAPRPSSVVSSHQGHTQLLTTHHCSPRPTSPRGNRGGGPLPKAPLPHKLTPFARISRLPCSLNGLSFY